MSDRAADWAAAAASPASGPLAGEVLLGLRGLTKRYARGDRDAVHDISLDFRAGELTAVLGPNGCGKSTLLRSAVRLVEPTSGQVSLCGNSLIGVDVRELRQRRLPAAMVFQHANLVGRRTAVYNAASGLIGRRSGARVALGFLSRSDLEEGAASLDRVGLLAVANQRADSLSGGQAQRVSIARALTQRPRVLLADEPVASLDPDAAEEVMHLLRTLAVDMGMAVVTVLHQPDLARWHSHRVIGMRDGVAVFDVPAAALDDAEVARLYRGRE